MPLTELRVLPAEAEPRRLPLVLVYAGTAAAGSLFALLTWQALKLELRHLVAFVAGIVLLSAGMVVLDRLRDLLLYVLAFNLPLTSIQKTLFLTEQTTFVTPGVQVGLADMCLGALYLVWALRIFVTRDEALPKLRGMDLWVFALVGAQALSMLSSYAPELTFFETIRVFKLGLLYFYLSRNIKRRDLGPLLAGVMAAILLQASLAIVQQRTGRLMGIGRTKGAEQEYTQYTVPGFEAVRRAEGTTFDSHALGLFMSMTLLLPLGLTLARAAPKWLRVVAGAAFVLGLPGLVVSFSRAGWLSFAVATLVLVGFFIKWGEARHIVMGGVLAACLAAPLLIPFGKYVQRRLFEAPPELITARIETMEMSMDLWRERPVTGIGANAYMVALEDRLSVFEGDPYFIPVHNMVLFILTETGIVGLMMFLGLMGAVLMRCWKVASGADPILRVLAASLFAAMVALQVAGIFDPIYITDVVYFTVWFLIGLSGAVYRLWREESDYAWAEAA
jgi:O-antigen ligase